VGLATEQLTRNLRRSTIAMLGLIVGVAALVALDTLGRATSFYLMTFIERMGQARLVRVRALGTKGLGTAARSFTRRDLERVRRELPHVSAVSARVVDFQAMAGHGLRTSETSVVGIDEHYLGLFGLELSEGRRFGPEDAARRANVAILGAEVAERLFGGAPALGEIAIVGGVPVRVVGVLLPSIFEDANASIFVPLETALARFHDCRKLDSFFVEADELDAVSPLAAALRRHLSGRDRHGAQQHEVRVNRTALMQIRDSILVLKVFVLVVGLVTLLLGGIGIMNVFLASVAERTVEIGIRKAVGATEGEIAAQILAEAVMICSLASCLGVTFGLLIVQGVVLVTGRPEMAAVSPPHILAVVLFSSLVGSLFSLSPAMAAARKDVVEAIRST